jgi:lipopolysaccharide export system ATP-binding protein
MFEGGILKAGVPEELVEDEMVRRLLRTELWIEKEKIEF